MPNNSVVIEVPNGTSEFRTIEEVHKRYDDKQIVEIVNRYVEMRRQQKKYRRTQIEQNRAIRELVKENPELLKQVEEKISGKAEG